MNFAETRVETAPVNTTPTTTRIEPSIIIVTVVIFVVVIGVIIAGLFSLRQENIQKKKIATSPHRRNNSVSTMSSFNSLDLEKNPDWVLEHQRRHIIQKSLASRSASPAFDLRPPTRALTRTASNGTLRSDWKELEAGMYAGLSSTSHPAIHAEQ